ncbi:type IX secretion system membrane protein PorP/SprF [Tenacibaculum piscium]|uniref:PorP/SprF family type IX secretion system membrane protein n=1 Tax=Tenacibaculum piscium TaxID=1458515 RepID=UPI001EFB064F|nr:type IX secretion system membrane protein PorP/SprF [Tenacibaculum piscium]MCG8183883.1 type IX secretion system membrane protein PorP/SprF [Tenacibaculum piscium]MCG8205191.1 type IX secretion system membrane protein PorP/SprF [Tenacibaculum piscium]
MTKKLFLIIFCWASFAMAQQRPQFSHYMYNLSMLNPAYSNADKSVVEFGAFYRNQWSGITGSPKTGLLFGHGALNKNLEGGFSILYDNIGNDIQTVNATVDLSYVVRLKKDISLSTGVKTGFSSYNGVFNNLTLASGLASTDPLFKENVSMIDFVFGAGVFLFSKKFYVGISSPNLIKSKLYDNTLQSNSSLENHYYGTAGYVYEVHADLKVKPSILVTYLQNSAPSIDVATNVLINQKFELGVGYNFSNTLNALVKISVSENVALGYSYGKMFNSLGSLSNGSHEFFILYNLKKTRGNRCYYDRFF